ncbi:diaminobutyrate acetyltransferase [Cohnella cellulosilytica]|uniref:L-2,4-diaminobutyric acid acetyltransferase n=1 Tax=Cohnella cellulosilytica TaxID=986710 RepID=A0ABW2FHL8_9BACL
MIGAHTEANVYCRIPGQADGARMWEMARDSGKLDLNSAYFYLAMSRFFSESCRVAIDASDDSLAGFIVGFRQPQRQNTLFIWQIAVAERLRGRGIAGKLLDDASARDDIRYVEATVSPSNGASRAMLAKWARGRGLEAEISPGFEERYFPGNGHEREDLYRIGPLK